MNKTEEKIQSLVVIFSEVESVPRLGYRGNVHFCQLVGALAGNLDNAIRTFPVRHELLLFTFKEDLPEDKFVRHKRAYPDAPIEGPWRSLVGMQQA